MATETEQRNPFIEHPAIKRAQNGGDQWLFYFPNGYTASVVRGPYTYGGDKGLWELAVLRDGILDYSTPVTDNVLGWQSTDDIRALLRLVAELPAVQA